MLLLAFVVYYKMIEWSDWKQINFLLAVGWR